MRVFANEKEVVQALQDIPGAGELRIVDFASIPFQEQVAVAHNTRYTGVAYHFDTFLKGFLPILSNLCYL